MLTKYKEAESSYTLIRIDFCFILFLKEFGGLLSRTIANVGVSDWIIFVPNCRSHPHDSRQILPTFRGGGPESGLESQRIIIEILPSFRKMNLPDN